MKAHRPSARYVPELDGLRVLLVLIVAWYHIWQQSWLTPKIGSYSLDYLVRAGYMPVDGTILLSGFLLFLPYARSMVLGEPVPRTREFYQRRIMRIVPSYYFVTLLMLFAVALPKGSYDGRPGLMIEDLVRHFTFTQTFDRATYLDTPLGAASWTIAIEMQAYLIFPLLANTARKHPWGVMATMAAAALMMRGWFLWDQATYANMRSGGVGFGMVVNQLINFMDVYAIGMAAALIYVRLTTRYPQDGRRFLWQAAATVAILFAAYGLVQVTRAQAYEGLDLPRFNEITNTHGSITYAELQAGQMMRRPVYALLMAVIVLALPFAFLPIRWVMGNPVMRVLSMVSMNFYLTHHSVSLFLKEIRFPAYQALQNPQMAAGGPEQPWAWQYTLACFGFSLLLAALITFLIEKPCAWLLKKFFRCINGAADDLRAQLKIIRKKA